MLRSVSNLTDFTTEWCGFRSGLDLINIKILDPDVHNCI